MLHNIPPILSPDILHDLRAMGHGDGIVIADANFPATSLGTRVHRLDGLPATTVLEAVLRLLPLDTSVTDPALTMQAGGDGDARPGILQEFQDIIDSTADHPAPLTALERYAFYERARGCFAVIQTGETRLFGNIILTKGIIPPA